MKKRFLFLMAIAGVFAINSCQKEKGEIIPSDQEESLVQVEPQNGEIIEGQYIVVLNNGTSKSSSTATYEEKVKNVKAFAESMLSTASISSFEVNQVYVKALEGFSVKMLAEDASKLKKDIRVKYIEPDRIISLGKPVPVPAGESIPWGITRVGHGNGIGKTAWIIDSGIDFDHPDLNVDVARSKTFVDNTANADDQNGHGSHVAGTVAAIDNEIGVVGVAAGASVVAVRVLDRKGSGSYSWVIAGIDYVAANAKAGDAANMSLGGPVSQALDDAVIAASNNGIFFALAAGNETDDANNHSPARANGQFIWTISAMDINNNFASFSNYANPPVDYCEPGVNIYSTYKSGGYATLSGTSMAAPHMCGILLMTNGNPKTDGYVKGDPDGNADPIGTL